MDQDISAMHYLYRRSNQDSLAAAESRHFADLRVPCCGYLCCRPQMVKFRGCVCVSCAGTHQKQIVDVHVEDLIVRFICASWHRTPKENVVLSTEKAPGRAGNQKLSCHLPATRHLVPNN